MSRPAVIELEAVLEIIRRGSFRAAALQLGMSTTALSNAIAKLELARHVGKPGSEVEMPVTRGS